MGIANMHRTPCLAIGRICGLSSPDMVHQRDPGMLQLRLLTGCEEGLLRPYILAS